MNEAEGYTEWDSDLDPGRPLNPFCQPAAGLMTWGMNKCEIELLSALKTYFHYQLCFPKQNKDGEKKPQILHMVKEDH